MLVFTVIHTHSLMIPHETDNTIPTIYVIEP